MPGSTSHWPIQPSAEGGATPAVFSTVTAVSGITPAAIRASPPLANRRPRFTGPVACAIPRRAHRQQSASRQAIATSKTR